jgi:hypothetical protein
MNERIKELAEQAYEQQPLMVANRETFEIEHKIGHGGAPMYHRVFNQEKFAELIVKECLAQADNIREGCEVDGEDEQALGADWVGLAIARHFGVKE